MMTLDEYTHKIMTKHKRSEHQSPKHALQEAIGFTLEDLEINDKGMLSMAQLKSLKQDCVRWFLSNSAITVVNLLAYNGYQSGPKTYNDIGGLILFSLLILPFFLFTLNTWVRLLIDFLDGKVASVEGSVELDVLSNRGGTRYKITSQGIVFQPMKPVFLSFKNNEPYLIYFAPYSKTIVSAQWLRE